MNTTTKPTENELFKSLAEFKKAYLPEQYKRGQLDKLWHASAKKRSVYLVL